MTTGNDKSKERKRKLDKLEIFKLPGRESRRVSGRIQLEMDGKMGN